MPTGVYLRTLRLCEVDGCDRKHCSGGFCARHYQRVKANGSPDIRRSYKHGEAARTPEYWAWTNMIARCTNPEHKEWHNYGARGITVCGEWRNSFVAFLVALGRKTSPEHSLDRIDNNGNYEPGNVRWATKREQLRNTRRNRLVTFNGNTQCIKDMAKQLGTTYQTLQYRLKRGIPLGRPFTGKKIGPHASRY